MAGHSKWKTIKRKKAITDSRRASNWTKLIREITVAAKAGGGDPNGNARLRKAIDDGKAGNMPGENIERAIKKGTGELEGVSYEEVMYEGYGPGGSAILIDGSTDNANRTVADIRHAFSRNHGNLGASNSVAWMFDRTGQIIIAAGKVPEEKAMEDALDAGASDFTADGEFFVVSTEPNSFHSVSDALLDVRGLREVRGAMRRLAQGGTSLVLVTHQLEDIVPEVDRVVTLCGGRVRHDGSKEEILRAGPLREVFGVDVEVQRAGDLYHMV